MKAVLVTVLLVTILPSHPAVAQNYLSGGVGNCFPPADPFPYKLSKSDPLYETARKEHQVHLEALENYVNCLDRERGEALEQLKTSFDLFMANFGKDAVMKYAAEKNAEE